MKSNQLCRDFQTAFAGADVGGGGLVGAYWLRNISLFSGASGNRIKSNAIETRRDKIECCFWSAV